MVKQELKAELWRRICRCKAAGDWRGVEVYTAAWQRVNLESEADLRISGLARRMAAKVAKVPLDARIGGRA